MKKVLIDWAEAALEAALIIFILFLFFWPVRVQGTSMENTLNNNDHVIVSRVFGFFNLYDKGDVVVFSYDENGEKFDVVKRIIAMSGDTVEIKNNNVYVNGELLDEPYASGENYSIDLKIIVPENEIFVLGDNRTTSHDSRIFGTINKDLITAKVIFKVYPFDEICIVK